MAIRFPSIVKRLGREERGASLVEYAVLLGLITALGITAITALGGNITTAFTNLNTRLTSSNTNAN